MYNMKTGKWRMSKIIIPLFGKYAIMKYIDYTPKWGTREYDNWKQRGYF